MMTHWSIIITAIGAIGWLLLLREMLLRWQQGRANFISNSPFIITGSSRPVGRIQFISMEWKDHEYCIAVDVQGAYMHLLDKHPLQRSEQ